MRRLWRIVTTFSSSSLPLGVSGDFTGEPARVALVAGALVRVASLPPSLRALLPPAPRTSGREAKMTGYFGIELGA